MCILTGVRTYIQKQPNFMHTFRPTQNGQFKSSVITMYYDNIIISHCAIC